jgi:hypothetical protein
MSTPEILLHGHAIVIHRTTIHARWSESRSMARRQDEL